MHRQNTDNDQQKIYTTSNQGELRSDPSKDHINFNHDTHEHLYSRGNLQKINFSTNPNANTTPTPLYHSKITSRTTLISDNYVLQQTSVTEITIFRRPANTLSTQTPAPSQDPSQNPLIHGLRGLNVNKN